jgi:hypothetical protein
VTPIRRWFVFDLSKDILIATRRIAIEKGREKALFWLRYVVNCVYPPMWVEEMIEKYKQAL